jgi:hypothetical protein
VATPDQKGKNLKLIAMIGGGLVVLLLFIALVL